MWVRYKRQMPSVMNMQICVRSCERPHHATIEFSSGVRAPIQLIKSVH